MKNLQLRDDDAIEVYEEAAELVDEDFDVAQFHGDPVTQDVVEILAKAYIGQL